MPNKRPGENIKLNGIDDLLKPSSQEWEENNDTAVSARSVPSTRSNKYLGSRSGKGYRTSAHRGAPRTFYLENQYSFAIDKISHETGLKPTKVINMLLGNLAELDQDFAEVVRSFQE